MRRRIFALSLGMLLVFCATAGAQKKKKKGDEDDITQTLPLLKDPPFAVAAETGRLVFHVSPLSAKGLLSQQIRDALKSLLQLNRGAAIVKLRAFVSGSGDIRRVQTIVSEVFTDRKLPLPALSTIQVGALPMEGAQVIFESVSVDKKVMNPQGLAFISGAPGRNGEEAVRQLQIATNAAGIKTGSLLRTTCFLSSLEELPAARTAVQGAFPSAVANYVQPQRLALETSSQCEAVGRLDTPPASAVVWMSPQAALVNSPKIILSGIQMAFGEQDPDIHLAFERLKKELEMQGVTYKDVFWSSIYQLTRPVAQKAETIRFEFYDRSHPPAGTILLFEGLPSLDASAAMDILASAPN
jgi:enamine deaminase RidA (YjgF/YER057c/UK114 family)